MLEGILNVEDLGSTIKTLKTVSLDASVELKEIKAATGQTFGTLQNPSLEKELKILSLDKKVILGSPNMHRSSSTKQLIRDEAYETTIPFNFTSESAIEYLR